MENGSKEDETIHLTYNSRLEQIENILMLSRHYSFNGPNHWPE
ncbi:hypothetical protein FIV00_04335 [Labrenzia sp. THAF82]|nr:hypothetical protein FIV00_04335 [Labrenzia sp. THAF82]